MLTMEQIVFIEWDILSSSITNENLIFLVLSIINTALFVLLFDWIMLKCLETECVWSHTITYLSLNAIHPLSLLFTQRKWRCET